MFGDFIKSIWDNTETRVTNPLLGTIASVWIIHNFQFFYILLNFEDGVTLTQKVVFISDYFNEYGWGSFSLDVLYALVILLVTYIFLLASRALTNAYSRGVDELNKWTDKGSVVSLKKYDSLRQQFNRVSTDLINNENEIARQEEYIKKLQNDITK